MVTKVWRQNLTVVHIAVKLRQASEIYSRMTPSYIVILSKYFFVHSIRGIELVLLFKDLSQFYCCNLQFVISFRLMPISPFYNSENFFIYKSSLIFCWVLAKTHLYMCSCPQKCVWQSH